MQAQVLAQGQKLSGGPALMIVEAPTGEGKTEAALALLDEFGSIQGLRGGYFALPTQATSNSHYRRTRVFLQQRFPGDRVQLQLLHGPELKRYYKSSILLLHQVLSEFR